MLYRYKQKSYVVWSKQEEEDRAVHVLYITVDYCRLHEKWTSRETQTHNIVCYTHCIVATRNDEEEEEGGPYCSIAAEVQTVWGKKEEYLIARITAEIWNDKTEVVRFQPT